MDPAGTCAVDDAGAPRACNPAELSFEEQLVAVLDNYGSYSELYDTATMTRGTTALNLVLDREPDFAQRYQPGDSLRQLIETKYPYLDPDGVVNEITRAVANWRVDAISRGIICDDGSVLAAAGMIGAAVARQGGLDEFMSPDTGGGGGGTSSSHPSSSSTPKLLPSPKWRPTNFGSGELDKHFAKHAPEWGFGNITKDAYLKRARSLLSKEPSGNILGYTRPSNGDVLRYNVRTNEFAVAASDGRIRTLFRPKDGIAYWNKQISP